MGTCLVVLRALCAWLSVQESLLVGLREHDMTPDPNSAQLDVALESCSHAQLVPMVPSTACLNSIASFDLPRIQV